MIELSKTQPTVQPESAVFMVQRSHESDSEILEQPHYVEIEI